MNVLTQKQEATAHPTRGNSPVFPLVDGDIVGARISEVSRTDVTLHGVKCVKEDNTYDPFVGPSQRYIQAAMEWLEDDRFVEADMGNWVEWDSLVLCEDCFTGLDSVDDTCPDCGGEGEHPYPDNRRKTPPSRSAGNSDHVVGVEARVGRGDTRR